ncbi:MAG: glycosyltransferase family 1 protein [Rubrivivax sp.]|nr:glycosyltransferase family 1 protein [Rubrivivax sp.]
MRIAMVTETYPPEVNGVALTVARVVQGLRSRQHSVQLIRPRQSAAGDGGASSGRFDEVLLGGLPVPRYPHLRMGVPSTRALVSLWTRQRPDLVHIATEGPLGWSALRAALKLKLPVASDFRTNFQSYMQHYGMAWLRKPMTAYLRKFHNRTRVTCVPTPALRDELSALGFERLRVVPRGVDTQRFDPARRSAALREQWGAGPGTPVMLCVSRLAPEKNLSLLLDIFDTLRAERADLRLVLVGDGPMKETIASRSPHCLMAGMRHGEDLAAHYASADLFVFPSLTETFGNVTLEALSSGLPVVAFRQAAAGLIIQDGRQGLLAPPDDPAALLQATRRAVDDEPLRQSLGLQARQTALTLDWERVIDQFEALLLETQTPLPEPVPQPDLRAAVL